MDMAASSVPADGIVCPKAGAATAAANVNDKTKPCCRVFMSALSLYGAPFPFAQRKDSTLRWALHCGICVVLTAGLGLLGVHSDRSRPPASDASRNAALASSRLSASPQSAGATALHCHSSRPVLRIR